MSQDTKILPFKKKFDVGRPNKQRRELINTYQRAIKELKVKGYLK